MARTFRRHRTQHPISELNVTNLIDLGFTLLIIFMIATPLITEEQTIPLNLPVESRTTQQRPDSADKFASVTVRADGSYQLEARRLTLAELGRELDRFAGEPKPPVLRIRTDANATAQHWVSLMAELRKRNLTRISIDTRIAN